MKWSNHSDLKGKHAVLSPSNFVWLRYDEKKLKTVIRNRLNKFLGTKIHAFAATAIELGQKLPKSSKTLNMYVNDAIGFRLDPEVVLYYSKRCYGTADAIRFDERTHTLRIHDLKTGIIPAHMDQLRVYAALYCLEYKVDPKTIEIILRIYQNNSIVEEISDPQCIKDIMDKIVKSSKVVDEIFNEENVYDIEVEVSDDAN